MRFLLDTNILSDLVRHPRGRIFDRISDVGEEDVCTSIVVAAELRLGATKKKCSRLTSQLEAVLGAIEVLALEAPVDAIYGVIRAGLEQIGQPIGANDLLIAAHALTLDLTVVTDNESEFLRIDDLRVENWLREGRAGLAAISPDDELRRRHSMRGVEPQSFREVPTGSMACLPPPGGLVAEAMIVPVMGSARSGRG